MNAYELALQLAEKAKAKPQVRASKDFVRHFDFVTQYYGCTLEEIDQMKAAARKDMQGAEVCFRAIYERVV